MTSDDPAEVAKDTASRAKGAVAEASDNLSDATASAGDRASKMAGKVSDKASDIYRQARDNASDLGDRMPGSASEAMDAGRRVYNRGNDQLARQIGHQPIEALLLAGAIGYLVGWAANCS